MGFGGWEGDDSQDWSSGGTEVKNTKARNPKEEGGRSEHSEFGVLAQYPHGNV